MDRAQWTLQSTSTEDTENNYFEGSLRVKRKKGKPSFTLNSEGTNPNNTVNDAAPAPAAEPNQSQFTAEELEQMWGDFASSFASTTTQPSDESQPISIASSATPLDFSVLQQVAYPAAATTGPTTFASATSSGSGEKPTSNVAAETAPLSSEDTSAEIPARKRPRLANLPQSTVGSNGFNDSGNVSGSKRPSYTPGVPIAVSNAVPVLSSGAHTSTSNPRQEHGNSRNGHPVMSAHAAAIASAHNGGSVGCDQVLAPDAAADALKTVQPWHTTKDGPVRQRMVDGMLRRLCGSVEAAGAGAGAKTGAAVVATGEGGEALPEWVEARRNRCMRVEAHLYHSSTSRGEYMYRVLK